MLELVLRPLADAFMQVGVFVALLVAPFGWARYRWGARFDAMLERHRGLGPIVAALLTVPPGCGGAIIVMSVYARGAVSFGAAVSALVATMGDACWVLLAADPVLTLKLKVLLVITGTVTGYVVDALHISPALHRDEAAAPVDATARTGVSASSADRPARTTAVAYRSAAPPASPPGSPVALAMNELGVLPALLWLFLAGGLLLSLPVTFQLLDPAALGHALLGDVDPYLALGAVGTTLCVLAFVRGGCKVADDDPSTASPGSMTQVLRHGGTEVAFVTVWVAAAYVSWSLLSHLVGWDPAQLPLYGAAGVLLGAFVGLVPGCAIQIIFAGIFIAGGMPLSTLVANTVSQDGDALIPLLALEHRSALLATVLTTVPSLVVGFALLLLA
jgi:hypothetical protein